MCAQVTNRVRRLDRCTYVVDCPLDGFRVRTHLVAGVGARFLSSMIDLFIEATVCASVVVPLALFQFRFPPVIYGVLAVSLDFLYHLFMESLTRGQSPGKNIVGIRVVSVDGTSPSVGQILIRNVCRLFEGAALLWIPAGTVAIFHAPARRWGDRLGRTIVRYDEPFREMLWRAGIGDAMYSTSPDAALLEGFVLREAFMPELQARDIARELSSYFMRKYNVEEPGLQSLFSQGLYREFLRELYAHERKHAEKSEEPSPPNE